MSRPEERRPPPVSGQPITLALARAGKARVRAVVTPMTGAQEMTLAERRGAGQRLTPVAIEKLVLEMAVSEIDGVPPAPGSLDALLVGDRNRLVLAVLSATYGPPGTLLMRCHDDDCASLQELPFDAWAVLDLAPDGQAGAVVDAGDVRLRLPVGRDIAAAAATPGVAGQALVRRCIVDADEGADVAEVLEREVTRRDPCAEIRFVAPCTGCGATVQGLLDPLALLIAEMDRLGGVLVEIDRLARAYHWSEAELLGLPAHRRRRYLGTLDAAGEPERWAS